MKRTSRTRTPRTIDGRRGAPPDILADGADLMYMLEPPGIPKGSQLVIRCDEDGGVWIAIRPLP